MESNSSVRSSDCYYRDQKPEVIPEIVPAPTYQQSSGINSSNNKYYAEMGPLVAEDLPLIAKLQMPPKEVELEILDGCYGLSTIQAAFEDGATSIIVKAYDYIVTQLQVAVDISVGRGELTREQTDSIVFVVLAPEALLSSEEVAPPIIDMPEATAILNVAPKQSRKKAKRGKSEEITLKDIEAAFGGDDSDD